MSLYFAVHGLGVKGSHCYSQASDRDSLLRAQSFQTVKFTNAKGKVIIIIQVLRSGEVDQKNIWR